MGKDGKKTVWKGNPAFRSMVNDVSRLRAVETPLGETWALSHHALQRAAQRAGIETGDELARLLETSEMSLLCAGVKERGGKIRNLVHVRFPEGYGDFVAAVETTDRMLVLATLMPYELMAQNVRVNSLGEYPGVDGHFQLA